MTFFLVFLAVVLIGAVLWASTGGRSGKPGGRALPALLDAGLEQPPANLPPVLLPANAAPQDVDRVRFALGLRGYRMDQVDQVLDELRDQLAASRQEVETLKARLQAVEAAGPSTGTGTQTEPPVAEAEGNAGAGSGPGEARA
ncbi:DivIVA domain-containing protein [Arthrobacter sp. V1I9]|uniref:DivIVA domain-containing protein n=1 Tax=Arthrobacter sp. V1I9 TaxID=3042275 RepID=UPI00279289A3|nr:DivIVA domain-containing protein [Arthrobacter sp. V1I9]MDQ0868667.1 DivIVA domain-containing protein [Arthrobacter sp. V1I9]